MKAPDEQLKAIGKRIRLARIAAPPPLDHAEELARRCGMSVQLLYLYETGAARQQPDKLQKIAQVLGFADRSVFLTTGEDEPFFGLTPRRKTQIKTRGGLRTRGRVRQERSTGSSGGPVISAALRPPEPVEILLQYHRQDDHTYTVQGHVAGPEGVKTSGPIPLQPSPELLLHRWAPPRTGAVGMMLLAGIHTGALGPSSEAPWAGTDAKALVEQVGRSLYEQLIPPEMAKVLLDTLEVAEKTPSRVRLLLSLKPPELAHLPWEYLYAPPRGFLALEPPVSLVRTVEIAGREPTGRTPAGLRGFLRFSPLKPLRILLVTTNPPDVECHHFDAVRETYCLKAALCQGIAEGRIVLDELPNATSERLIQQLRHNTYHVIHFAAHGGYIDQSPVIYMQGRHGKRSYNMLDKELTQLLISSPVQVVVLNVCHTSASMAQSLTEASVSPVVALQFNWPDVASELFAREFYSRLVEGSPVEECVASARRLLFQSLRGTEWGTPVLFVPSSLELTPVPREHLERTTRTPNPAPKGAAMLSCRPEWLPDVDFDCAELQQAVDLYRWGGAIGEHQWVEKRDLKVVGQYLVSSKTEPYWRVILQGGVRGYSLYLHEWIELDCYARQDVNAFDAEEREQGYRVAHTAALLYEHCFLQVVAQMMGYSFTLAELITHNPHGDPPDPDAGWDGDWQLVQTHQLEHMTDAEQQDHPEHKEQVQEFYTRLGFQEVWRDA